MRLNNIRIVVALMILNIAVYCMAQKTTNISNYIENRSNGLISINQPEQLYERLNKSKQTISENSISDTENNIVGYRIQVFSDNNQRTAKSMAQSRERQITTEFSDLSVYLIYKSPSWRVRVGDFKTRGEAEQVMHEIRTKFPSFASEITIVVDKINLIEK